MQKAAPATVGIRITDIDWLHRERCRYRTVFRRYRRGVVKNGWRPWT
jgi:hypothetical protein